VSPARSAKAGAAATAGSAAVLPPEIFDAKVNVPLIHQVVVAQEAAARQGTHATKTRGDVRGGGKKPYRQKGTGRARQGSTRAPQFTGGGVVHGPHPRSYEQHTPKKMKAAALRGALSDRARHGRVHVVASLVDGQTPKTKAAVAALAALTGVGPTGHVLVVIAREDQLTRLSLRNAPGVHLLDSGQLNTRDVLVSDHVVFTQEGLDSFVARATGAVAAGNGTTPATAPAATAVAAEPAAATASEPVVEAPVVEDAVAETAAVADESDAPKAAKPRASRAKPKQEDAQ
jgi:large subunit ribosomal protein L4